MFEQDLNLRVWGTQYPDVAVFLAPTFDLLEQVRRVAKSTNQENGVDSRTIVLALRSLDLIFEEFDNLVYDGSEETQHIHPNRL